MDGKLMECQGKWLKFLQWWRAKLSLRMQKCRFTPSLNRTEWFTFGLAIQRMLGERLCLQGTWQILECHCRSKQRLCDVIHVFGPANRPCPDGWKPLRSSTHSLRPRGNNWQPQDDWETSYDSDENCQWFSWISEGRTVPGPWLHMLSKFRL